MKDKYRKMDLKLCPSCNAFQDSNKEECPNCGYDLTDVPIFEQKGSAVLPTRWLKFYIYIFLPFRILTSFNQTLAQYVTLIWAGYDAQLTPMTFVPIIIWDIFICFVIYGLHKRRIWGWICNWIYMGMMVLISPINFQNSIGAYIGAVIILSLAFFLPNYIYFKKRRLLFLHGRGE